MRPSSGTRCAWNAGFTLLELLVALALLGLLATMSLGGLRLGARTWETVTARSEETGRALMVRAFLSRELAQAMPLTLPAPGGSDRLAYDGETDSLTFVSPLASHFGLGGAQRLRLAVLDGEGAPEDGKRLVLLRRAFYPDDEFSADDGQRDEVHLLLDGIAEAAFSYRAAGDESGWADTWREQEELPGLIRLDITFRDTAAGDWPSLVAVRRVTADADCLIPAGATPCGTQ